MCLLARPPGGLCSEISFARNGQKIIKRQKYVVFINIIGFFARLTLWMFIIGFVIYVYTFFWHVYLGSVTFTADGPVTVDAKNAFLSKVYINQ